MKFKTTIFLFSFLLLRYFSIAQANSYPKLEELFNSSKYEVCIEKAEKYSKKDKKQALPYYYSAFSYFELYKISDDSKIKDKYLKKALSNAKIAKLKDRESSFKEQFSTKYSELQKETHSYASKIYAKQKEKSKFFYNHLVTIYQDTTNQYLELNGLEKASASTVGLNLEGKPKIGPNLTDENGFKQGLWRKVYKNGQTAYEVRFENGQPVGIMKRFHENGKLSVYMNYGLKGGDYASVIMYSNRGVKRAEGFYNGREKDSTWRYYSSDKNLAEATAERNQSVKGGVINYLINETNYENGKKEGTEKKFYPNGNMAQLITWKQDKLHGLSKEYFKGGNIKLEFNNKNDKRYGAYNQYYIKGRPEITGYYAGGHKHGKWVYYTSTGDVEKEIIYLFGVAKNQDELDDEETKLIQDLEKNKGKLEDPEKFQNDPDRFIRGFQR